MTSVTDPLLPRTELRPNCPGHQRAHDVVNPDSAWDPKSHTLNSQRPGSSPIKETWHWGDLGLWERISVDKGGGQGVQLWPWIPPNKKSAPCHLPTKALGGGVSTGPDATSRVCRGSGELRGASPRGQLTRPQTLPTVRTREDRELGLPGPDCPSLLQPWAESQHKAHPYRSHTPGRGRRGPASSHTWTLIPD